MIKEKNIRRVFTHPPVLTTERLILRPMRESDAENMFEYASDTEVTKYLLWDAHPTLKYTKDYLKFIQTKYKEGDFFDWAVIIKDERGKEDGLIGTVGFASIDFANNWGEVGYVINPSYQRCGYATEAVKRVLRFAFVELEFNRVQARYIIGNDISRRVMEKSGMRFEGVQRGSLLLRGEYRDVGMCALTLGDWLRSND